MTILSTAAVGLLCLLPLLADDTPKQTQTTPAQIDQRAKQAEETWKADHPTGHPPDPGPDDDFIYTGQITGMGGLRLLPLNDQRSMNDHGCVEAAICLGPPGVEIFIDGVDIYLTTINGRKTLVLRAGKGKK